MRRRQWMRPRNSLPRRYQAQYGPPLMQVLLEAWRVPPVERAALWRAMCASCWSDTVDLREALIAFRPDRQDGRTFLAEVFTPAVVISTLERLVQEKVLTRVLASKVEECVLRETGTDGTWQPSHGPARAVRKGKDHRTAPGAQSPYAEPGA